jgi:hypothetical protein
MMLLAITDITYTVLAAGKPARVSLLTEPERAAI